MLTFTGIQISMETGPFQRIRFLIPLRLQNKYCTEIDDSLLLDGNEVERHALNTMDTDAVSITFVPKIKNQ